MCSLCVYRLSDIQCHKKVEKDNHKTVEEDNIESNFISNITSEYTIKIHNCFDALKLESNTKITNLKNALIHKDKLLNEIQEKYETEIKNKER